MRLMLAQLLEFCILYFRYTVVYGAHRLARRARLTWAWGIFTAPLTARHVARRLATPWHATKTPDNVHPARAAIHDADTPGARAADLVADVVGSWPFVAGQAALMVLWVVVNTLAAARAIRFDGYPFVFMNLFMSAEAAFATPIILMSQNRPARRDRKRDDLEAAEVDALWQKIVDMEHASRDAARVQTGQLADIARMLSDLYVTAGTAPLPAGYVATPRDAAQTMPVLPAVSSPAASALTMARAIKAQTRHKP